MTAAKLEEERLLTCTKDTRGSVPLPSIMILILTIHTTSYLSNRVPSACVSNLARYAWTDYCVSGDGVSAADMLYAGHTRTTFDLYAL